MEANPGIMGVPGGNFRTDGRQAISKNTIEEIVPNLKKNCIGRSNRTLTFSKSPLKETHNDVLYGDYYNIIFLKRERERSTSTPTLKNYLTTWITFF